MPSNMRKDEVFQKLKTVIDARVPAFSDRNVAILFGLPKGLLPPPGPPPPPPPSTLPQGRIRSRPIASGHRPLIPPTGVCTARTGSSKIPIIPPMGIGTAATDPRGGVTVLPTFPPGGVIVNATTNSPAGLTVTRSDPAGGVTINPTDPSGRVRELPKMLPEDSSSQVQEYGVDLATISIDPQNVGPISRDLNSALRDLLRGAAHSAISIAADSPSRQAAPAHPSGQLIDGTMTLANAFNDRDDPHISSLRIKFLSRASPGLDSRQALLGVQQTHSYVLHPAGEWYPYRGRGPVWKDNSCALDCCLVAAQLLNIGQTTIDIGSRPRIEWINSLTDLEKSAMTAFEIDWGVLTPATSIQTRHGFLRKILAEMNANKRTQHQTRLGSFLPATGIWSLCTSMASQFSFTTIQRNTCTNCSRVHPNPPTPTPATDITLDVLRSTGQTPTMEEMLQQYFGPIVPGGSRANCVDCKATASARRRRVVVGDLPVRLVVKPADNYRDVKNANADRLTFNYLPSDDLSTERQVSYRWLGGIYLRNGHYRLYWTDCDYITPNGNVKVYDGKIASGSIVGGVPPCHPENRIPEIWRASTEFFFYERINEDNMDAALDIFATEFENLRTSAGVLGPTTKKIITTTTVITKRGISKRKRDDDDDDEDGTDSGPSARKRRYSFRSPKRGKKAEDDSMDLGSPVRSPKGEITAKDDSEYPKGGDTFIEDRTSEGGDLFGSPMTDDPEVISFENK